MKKKLSVLQKNHALEHYLLPAGSIVPVCQYMQIDDKTELLKEKPICFDKGAHVFPNTVDSTILSIIMEPDFSPQNSDQKITLLRMGLISTDEKGLLPLYRYCHNLKDGKI